MDTEKKYLDSLFQGFSAESLPIKDNFGKNFTDKNFNVPLKISGEQIDSACKRFDCSAEIFLMSAYAVLLARFVGADEILFAATADKKIPVALTFSSSQSIAEFTKNLRDQVNLSRETITTPYEKIAADYNFPNVPEFISHQQEIGDKTFAMVFDENSCAVTIKFDGAKYSDALVESFANAYKNVVAQFLIKENLNDIEWLTAEEISKLQQMHDTDWKVVDRPAYRLLQDSAEKYPDRVAAIANGKSLTYSELNAAANRLGHILKNNGVGVEKIVAVMLDRGLEVYIARQGILKSGGAFLSMTPDYPDDRVEFILNDADAKHLITTRDLYNERKDFFDKFDVKIIFVEEIGDEPAENLNVEVASENLAYLIYTSGSTGKPKGVMLTNHNLVNFVDANPKNHEILGYTERGKISLALAAITFDVSIMEEFIPLANGMTICMVNEDEIHNPMALKEVCDKNLVDMMSCTPSYLANLIDFPEFEPVIKRLNSVDFGAEAFPSALFTKLRAVNPNIYIMNGYGPTEATISCTMKAIESAENITIGFPNSNIKVVMTDEKNQPLPIGALGEMTIIGDGIGRGYRNRDDLTKKVFIQLWGRPAYKSGDLARLLPNGEIAFHGRVDNQVKLRGLRVELGEIETVLNNFDGVKSSIVVVKKNATGDYLAGYFVAEKKIDIDALKKHLAASLTAYMVPGVLMQLESFPLTANRKIDKKALPEPEVAVSTVEIIPPQNEMQQKIFDCVVEVVGTDNFGINTDFQNVGLTSIGTIRLNVLLSREFNKAIRSIDIKNHPTVEKLEKFLSTAQEAETYEMQFEYPLSQTQEGVFVECVAHPNTTIYNIPCLYRLDDGVDVARLQNAVKATVDAHPYLKMTLALNEENEILACRHDDFDAVVNILHVDKLPSSDELVTPYELLNKPLYRINIYVTPTQKFLFMDCHHILSDGTSFDILIDDINAAYDGKILDKETYTGFEFALDEEKIRKSDELVKAKNYYDSIFSGREGECKLFKDFDAVSTDAAAYERGSFEISVDAVKNFCAANKVSINAFFNAAFGFTLAKYLYREDAIFTTVYHGRNDSRLLNSVGMFVKALPVAVDVANFDSVKNYVDSVGKQLAASMANDIYSFDEIVRAYGIKDAMMFVWQGERDDNFKIAGAPAEERMLDLNQSRSIFGMDLFIKDGAFCFETEYRPDIYSATTVKNFAACMLQVSKEFLAKENLADVNILTAEELTKLQQIHDTDWKVVYRPAYRLLQDSAEKYPNRVAAIANEKSLTYSELNAAANRLGHILKNNGVGVEKIVAVMLNRGLEVYVARQGILKAGGAFLPMTPDYPNDRVEFILSDADAKHLVTTRQIYDARKNFFDKLDVKIIFVDEIGDESAENLNVEVAPENLAYCIYTSGSTGKPKGVMLTNHNLVNFVDANPKNHEILGFVERGKISLALAAITFDVSIMEEFIPLAHGMTICMANEDEIHNPMALKKLCDKNLVDVMSCTPSYLANFIDFPEFESVIKRLKSVDLGAEAFPPALFTKLRAINPNIYIMNGYGPTEATISCTMKAIESAENITIGFPNANVKVVMLDKQNQPLPIGALGEMTIIGDGIGRGYRNRDDLTKKVFIQLWGRPAYKSGDLARLLPNGEIDFHGRTDNQVKVRGLRVELGEIESVLNNFDGVKSSVVVVKKDDAGDYLAGYFVAEKKIDIDALKKHLAASLTAYMVPGVLMQIDKIPLTANGKIDKKALPEVAMQVEVKETKVAATQLQQTLCEIFAKSLGRKSIGADENFFESGGTSLAASKVAMAAYLKQLPIVYADIFKYPTAEKLEAYILSQQGLTPPKVEKKVSTPKISEPVKVTGKSFLEKIFQIERALEKNRVEYVGDIRHDGLGDVLLTGATGFLGVHILYELLKNTSSKIFCFVRKGKAHTAKERLKNIFIYYFNSSLEKTFDERVEAIDGDITNAAAVDTLMDYPFKTLINCAACVKHFASDDILTKVNVEGVQNLVNLCVKKKCRLIQISTVSIAGENVDNKLSPNVKLAENNFYIGQEVTSNKYVYSKFQAEEMILSAIGQGILDAKIMRVGNLMSRISDGEFQINSITNSFMRDLRGYAAVGKFPVTLMDEPEEFSPIDETAHMIVKLADTNAEFTVFHVVNCHRVQMGDVIHAMNDYGIKIDVVSENDFNAALTDAMRDESKNLIVSNLIAYNDSGNISTEEIDCESAFTVKALYRLNCRWHITDDNYLRSAIKSLETLGFFDSERNF